MTINRRDFLRLSGTTAGAAFLGGFAPTVAHAATRMTGVTYLPQSYKALSFGSNGFVEHLKKNAAKAVQVDFFDSGKLLKADEQLPALRSGNIDFMFHTTSYITRSVPILGITGLPGVVEELYEHPERIKMGSPLFALINEQLAKDDLYMLSMGGGILEPEYLWSTKSATIESLDAIKGKRVRVVSFEATGVMEKFGAAAVRVPSSELYLAMQRGTVDAAVANISTIIGRSLQEQCGGCYRLPITAYGIGVFVQKSRWEKRPPEVRAGMEAAAAWFDAESAKEANAKIYPNEFWPKVKAAGVKIVEPSKADIARLDTAGEAVRAAWISQVGADVGKKAIALALGQAKS
ncbi:MAG: TRAP transporter substrate-binding protein DctP [Burkholderiales bacterium]|nr:TRAP transporter substrate-binding protein DctP [Burkholderiales bacterium]